MIARNVPTRELDAHHGLTGTGTGRGGTRSRSFGLPSRDAQPPSSSTDHALAGRYRGPLRHGVARDIRRRAGAGDAYPVDPFYSLSASHGGRPLIVTARSPIYWTTFCASRTRRAPRSPAELRRDCQAHPVAAVRAPCDGGGDRANAVCRCGARCCGIDRPSWRRTGRPGEPGAPRRPRLHDQ
jgi:hypothetical protein